MFWDSFDVFKSVLSEVASQSDWLTFFDCGEMLDEESNILQFMTSDIRVSNWYTKHNFGVNYRFTKTNSKWLQNHISVFKSSLQGNLFNVLKSVYSVAMNDH